MICRKVKPNQTKQIWVWVDLKVMAMNSKLHRSPYLELHHEIHSLMLRQGCPFLRGSSSLAKGYSQRLQHGDMMFDHTDTWNTHKPEYIPPFEQFRSRDVRTVTSINQRLQNRWIPRPYSMPWRQIRPVAIGEYQASWASHSPVWLLTFTTSVKVSDVLQLCFTALALLQNFSLTRVIRVYESKLNNWKSNIDHQNCNRSLLFFSFVFW